MPDTGRALSGAAAGFLILVELPMTFFRKTCYDKRQNSVPFASG